MVEAPPELIQLDSPDYRNLKAAVGLAAAMRFNSGGRYGSRSGLGADAEEGEDDGPGTRTTGGSLERSSTPVRAHGLRGPTADLPGAVLLWALHTPSAAWITARECLKDAGGRTTGAVC